MVESVRYEAPAETRDLVTKHLGPNAVYDAGYIKNVTLKRTEAETRCSLVEEIEYDFCLALNKGKHYLG